MKAVTDPKFDAAYFGQPEVDEDEDERRTYYSGFTEEQQVAFARFNFELIGHFLVEEEWSILDFGCSQGFFVRYANDHSSSGDGEPRCWGVDISEWAIQNGVSEDIQQLSVAKGSLLLSRVPIPDIVFSAYVLEHMSMQHIVDLGRWIEQHDQIKMLIFRVPIPLPDTDPVSYWKNDDDTHIHIRPIDWWIQAIQAATEGEMTCRQILWQCTTEVTSATFVFRKGPYSSERDIAPWTW